MRSTVKLEKQARDIILRTVAQFPGLVLDSTECDRHDLHEEVNGGDLVEWLTNEFSTAMHLGDSELKDWAINGTPDTPTYDAYVSKLWSR